MKLAFYKAFQSRATIVDKIIAIFSFGKYSHVELVFPNGDCFSISAREGIGRFKKINLDPDVWDIIELDSSISARELRKEAKHFLGFKYDFLGAIFSISPVCIQKNKKIFCSEVCTNLINKYPKYAKFGDGCKYSPSGLLTKLKDNNPK